ncbi:MAG TPA: hypothetical protein VGG72_27925 [Bryobacteraceae bacterium]|jgi:hypothetical protein
MPLIVRETFENFKPNVYGLPRFLTTYRLWNRSIVFSGAMIVPMEPITIEANGESFIGKRLLVGIRWTSKGEVAREEQFHGVILEADQEGLVIERADTGARVVLPPELQAAARGAYTLHATGEVVHDPDYLATWRFDQDQMPSLLEVPRGV